MSGPVASTANLHILIVAFALPTANVQPSNAQLAKDTGNHLSQPQTQPQSPLQPSDLAAVPGPVLLYLPSP